MEKARDIHSLWIIRFKCEDSAVNIAATNDIDSVSVFPRRPEADVNCAFDFLDKESVCCEDPNLLIGFDKNQAKTWCDDYVSDEGCTQ